MLSKLKSLYRGNVLPIGIDLGSHALKMAQVRLQGDKPELVAAASLVVPQELRRDPGALIGWFEQAARDLVARGGFQGRQAVLSLPAAWMHVTRLRLAEVEESAIKQALSWETIDKLPIHPSQAMIRHFVAGRVYQGSDQQSEIVVVAAKQALMNQFVESAAGAKLTVMGMCAEPVATMGLFTALLDRKNAANSTWCLIDVGRGGSRIYMINGTRLLFARTLPLGGDQFNAAVAKHLKVDDDQARALRRRLPEYRGAVNVASAGDPTAAVLARLPESLPEPAESKAENLSADIEDAELRKVDQAQSLLVQRFVEEVRLSRQYFEATFPGETLSRLAFLGGEALHRRLCQQIAAGAHLPALMVDPLSRIRPGEDMANPVGWEPSVPQPGLAVALGLSLCGRQDAQADTAAA